MQEKRIDGLGALKTLLEPIRGKVKVDRYEMIAPRVDRDGDLAVFTYNLVSHGRRPDGRATETRWNVTAVYRREDGGWRIAHHHFSFTRPELKES
jgi:ketosteroid isomerase-like protein